MNTETKFVPYKAARLTESESINNSRNFYEFMDLRRTVREFSDTPVPQEVITNIMMTASTSPSGAHKQPWTFCAVSNPILKQKIRAAAEIEEYENYHGRMSDEWLKDLAPFATDWHKPFLEIAPWLIVVFRKIYDVEGEAKRNNYYVSESVGIACGFLLAAIHQAGLVALTHTPSPMNFLSEILERPKNEKPFLLIPVGYPAENTQVPNLRRKTAEEVIKFY